MISTCLGINTAEPCDNQTGLVGVTLCGWLIDSHPYNWSPSVQFGEACVAGTVLESSPSYHLTVYVDEVACDPSKTFPRRKASLYDYSLLLFAHSNGVKGLSRFC